MTTVEMLARLSITDKHIHRLRKSAFWSVRSQKWSCMGCRMPAQQVAQVCLVQEDVPLWPKHLPDHLLAPVCMWCLSAALLTSALGLLTAAGSSCCVSWWRNGVGCYAAQL